MRRSGKFSSGFYHGQRLPPKRDVVITWLWWEKRGCGGRTYAESWNRVPTLGLARWLVKGFEMLLLAAARFQRGILGSVIGCICHDALFLLLFVCRAPRSSNAAVFPWDAGRPASGWRPTAEAPEVEGSSYIVYERLGGAGSRAVVDLKLSSDVWKNVF